MIIDISPWINEHASFFMLSYVKDTTFLLEFEFYSRYFDNGIFFFREPSCLKVEGNKCISLVWHGDEWEGL